MNAETLFQSWERASYMGEVLGECNAMIVDENQFIKFITVSSPPPQKLKIPFVPPVVLRGAVAPQAQNAQHFLEVNLRHHNFKGWAVYS